MPKKYDYQKELEKVDKVIQDNEKIIVAWRNSATFFVRDALGINDKNGLSLTLQQEEALDELTALVWGKIRVARDINPSKKDKEYAKKRGISIMAGRGVGKDSFAAWAILWFLTCFPNPKIPCTAPTSDQLRNILWSEVSKWLNLKNKSGEFVCSVRQFFEINSDKIFLKEKKGKEWFAIARTAHPNASSDSQSETLAGFHENFMMVVIDEASGVADPVFKPLEGSTTGECNITLIIFNPTKRTGYAIETHQGKNADQWIRLHWDAEDSPLVSKGHIQLMEKKYGRDSDPFRISIKGVPPSSSSDSLIPWDWAYEASRREIDVDDNFGLVLGVDCAGHGDDKAAIVVRQGNVVLDIHTFSDLNTIELAGWVLHYIGEYDNPDAVCVDVIGLGAGVYDQIQLHYPKVYAVNVANVSSQPEKFMRLRDELWWKARDRFENGTIKIPHDDELIGELASPKFETDAQGRIKVEGKREMRRRGIGSPNKADALCLTFFWQDSILRSSHRYGRVREEELQPVGWMGV